MPATDFGLGRLVAPIGAETFFRDYWEKQPLVVPRGEPDYYAGLLPLAVGMPASNALAAMERPRAIVTVGVVAAAITLALVWGLMLEFGCAGFHAICAPESDGQRTVGNWAVRTTIQFEFPSVM